jgi:hypothetical protein
MTLSAPAAVQARLEDIEVDLAVRQEDYESAALNWFRSKRDRERRRAEEFIKAEGTVAERSALADRETALIGVDEEAHYEALRGVMRTLETRASIGQSILRAQSRAA